jgi:hypothetical protein
MIKTILLVNGPHDGTKVVDQGQSFIDVEVFDGGMKVGATIGYARYEIEESRERAFWLENRWRGPITQIITDDDE